MKNSQSCNFLLLLGLKVYKVVMSNFTYGSVINNPFKTTSATVDTLMVNQSVTCAGPFSLSNFTNATDFSGTTGALKILGGASIAQSLFANKISVNNGANVVGGMTADSLLVNGNITTSTVSCSTLTSASINTSNSINCGVLVSAGDVSGATLTSSGTITGQTANIANVTASGTLRSNSTTDAAALTTPNAGLYLPNSGAVIGKTLYVQNINTQSTITASTLTSTNFTSNSLSTSSATVNGPFTGQRAILSDSTDATAINSSAALTIPNGGLAVSNAIWGKTINASTSVNSPSGNITALANTTLTSQNGTFATSLVANSSTDATAINSSAAITIPNGGLSVGNTIWAKNINGSVSITAPAVNATNAALTNISSSGSINSAGPITIGNTSNPLSSTSSSASLTTKGGMAVTQDIWCNSINTNGTNTVHNIAGPCLFNNTATFANANDAASSASTNASMVVSGGISCNKTVFAQNLSTTSNLNVSTNFVLSSALVNASSSQSGTAVPTNGFRIRTQDATNANVNLTISNTALGNSYYESHMTFYSLGSSATSTNMERLVLGTGSNGGYLNYIVAGTGTTKPMNVLSGSIFSTGGSLSLAQNLNVIGTNDVNTSTPSSTSLYTAGGLYVSKQIWSNSTVNAVSPSSTTASIVTQGGIAAAKDIWSNNMFASNSIAAASLINSSMVYATYYVNSSQSIANRTMVALASTLVFISGNLNSAAFATTNSAANTYTALYSGLHYVSLTLRMTPSNPGTLEIIFSSGTNGSTTFPSSTNRMAHTQNYISTGIQVALNCFYLGYMQQGDVITPTLYYTAASGIGPSTNTVAGTDCLYTGVCLLRST